MSKQFFRGVLHSYSFRIALMYLLFFLFSTLILFVFIYFTSTRSVTEQLDETLLSDRIAFAERFEFSGLNGLIRLVNSRVQSQGHDAAYSLISDQQEIVAGNLANWPSIPAPSGRLEFVLSPVSQRGVNATFRGEILSLPDGYSLLIARSKSRIFEAQKKLIKTFIGATLITLILGLLGAYILSKRAVRRISSINRLCRSIVQGDFSKRLSVLTVQDDLDDLSVNINTMLDKIETLMQEIIQVSDNIAHDMRTPLSHLRLKLEAIQTQTSENELSYAQLGEAIAGADGIISTFNALLRISKIEAGKHSEKFKSLDLSALLEDVIELYSPLAEDKQQQISIQTGRDILMVGDRDLLFQAISNLLDNAIKYTPEQGHISIELRADNGSPEFKICDSGPGVPESELSELTRRYYRVDASRSLPGNGLGLSLVDAIARAHKARLIFSNNQPAGLCVSMVFPEITTQKA